MSKQPNKHTEDENGEKCMCNGVTATRTKCTHYAINGTPQCHSHQYFSNFTDEQIIAIHNKKAKICDGCKRYHFYDTGRCPPCLELQKEKASAKRKNKVTQPSRLRMLKLSDSDDDEEDEPSNDKQPNIIQSEKNIDYNTPTPQESRKLKMSKYLDSNKDKPCETNEDDVMVSDKCNGTTKTGNKCNKYKINGTDYCKFHDHLVGLTDEEIKNLVLCKRCNKIADCEGKVNCKKCALELSELQKERNKTPTCKGNPKDGKPCKSNSLPNSEYCGKHIGVAQDMEMAKRDDTKLCSTLGHNKDCARYLPKNYPYNSCSPCREGEKGREKQTRDSIVEENNKIIQDANILNKHIKCVKCNRLFKYGSSVTSKGEYSMKCPICFAHQQNIDQNRNRHK